MSLQTVRDDWAFDESDLEGFLDPELGGIISVVGNDEHSEILKLSAQEVSQQLEKVPWTILGSHQIPRLAWRDERMLYSVPTTYWLRFDGTILARIVGSVNPKKLALELEKAVDRL